MMSKGIFITGTDTGVGKTWVGTQLISNFVNLGINVVPRKPVESGWSERIEETDAWELANAASQLGLLDEVCPNRFPDAIAPARAAKLSGISLTLKMLLRQCKQNVGSQDYLVVEGAGGFYSPMAEGVLNADLAESLGLPVILVVNDKLGAINQVLLNVEAIQRRNLVLAAVVLNQKEVLQESVQRMNNFEDIKNLLVEPVFHINNLSEQIPSGLVKAVIFATLPILGQPPRGLAPGCSV
jgi:dethiobiotin synthetase